MTIHRTLGAACILLALAPAPLRADVLFTPYFGINFGGDSGKNFGDAFDAKRYSWGASIGLMGGGVFGIEGDFAYSPDFFGVTDVGGSGVFTGMGNLILGVPFGGQQGFGIRPFGVAGLGLLRSTADFVDVFEVGENNFSWNTGGGVLLFFGTRVGIRVDIRYFRTFDDLEIVGFEIVDQPGKVEFTRTSFGLVLRY